MTAGLIVPLATPALAVRQAIVREAAQSLGLSLADTLIEQLAAQDATPLQLMSLVLKVEDLAARSPGSLNEQQLAKLLQPQTPKLRLTVQDIALATAKRFQLKLEALVSASRSRTVVTARGVAIYLARTLLKTQYVELGRFFGNRDHSTIMHSFESTSSRLSEDRVLAATVSEIRRLLAPAVP